MIKMGLFTKRSHVHYERDESGRVVDRIEDDVSRGQHKHSYFDKLASRRQQSREYRRQAFREARHSERIKLKQEQGRRSASHPVTAMLPPRRVVHVHIGKKQYQKQYQQKVAIHPEKKQMTPAEFQKKLMKGFK
jgi:hypothetical protein